MHSTVLHRDTRGAYLSEFPSLLNAVTPGVQAQRLDIQPRSQQYDDQALNTRARPRTTSNMGRAWYDHPPPSPNTRSNLPDLTQGILMLINI